ncbi:unnamed protein product [Brugia timori]|uniref:Mitochondrial carrier protein n=1 Tax=Brugia timori TaxID=42155 RepID=A0A0R3RBN9_9BILA|nr:unnamed protein product [Brugia timori]
MLAIGYCSEHYDRKLERFGYFEPILHYLIGVVAGAAGVLTGHPLDTVKIRQQTETQSIYRCCSSIIQNESILGFFKGAKFCLFTSNDIFSNVYYSFIYYLLLKNFAIQE